MDFDFLILDFECMEFRGPTARQFPAKKAHPESKEKAPVNGAATPESVLGFTIYEERRRGQLNR